MNFVFTFPFILIYNLRCISAESNNTSEKQLLRFDPDTMDCIPGKVYKVDCNTCACLRNHSLMCSKMACLPKSWEEKFKYIYHNTRKRRSVKKEKKNKKYKDVVKFSKLPEGKCVPGKIYRTSCKLCYCDEIGKANCVPEHCDGKNTILRNKPLSPDDIRPPIKLEEIDKLPTLRHASSECIPGKSYKVQCNTCLCLSNRNTLCTKFLCLDHEELNKRQALLYSGKTCTDISKVQNGCVRCSCTDDVLNCTYIKDCTPSPLRSLHGPVPDPKYALDLKKDKCNKGMMYTKNCNRCYCVENGNLRCTAKVCLKYTEIQAVVAKLEELERYSADETQPIAQPIGEDSL